MRAVSPALLAGVAAIMLAGYAGLAEAKIPNNHVLTVRLPDGQVEQVRYVGDVPPTLIVLPEAVSASIDPGFPFGMLDQISAAMDRQAAAWFRTVNAQIAAGGDGSGSIVAGSGSGVCLRSVQISYSGDQAPRVVSRTSGDCAAAGDTAAPVALPHGTAPEWTPGSKPMPGLVQAKAANPYQGMLHTVSDRRP